MRPSHFIANETQIILDKTEASSNLVVQDGQTIIIGGLIREDKTSSGSGIPFSGSIPMLGYLFGNRTGRRPRTEIIILLTPHVIKDQREAKAITNEYVDNITGLDAGKGGLTRDEIQKGGVQIKKGLDQGESSGGDLSDTPTVIVPLPGIAPSDTFDKVPLAPMPLRP